MKAVISNRDGLNGFKNPTSEVFLPQEEDSVCYLPCLTKEELVEMMKRKKLVASGHRPVLQIGFNPLVSERK